jgi:hypothetical protein
VNNKINRCQPGFGSSCSLCCGSHNYTISPDFIEEIFVSRDTEAERQKEKHPENSYSEKIVKHGLQCSNVGISKNDPGIVCCLTYLDDHKEIEFDTFFRGTCKKFVCNAWINLTDRQVLFTAELMKDWYYYSLMLYSTDLVMDFCAEYEHPSDVPEEILAELKNELVETLRENDFYS